MTDSVKKLIYREIANATVKIWVDDEFQGTGFFITPDGYVLTAYHCIGNPLPDKIMVETCFDGKFEAQIDKGKSLQDLQYDIAVLKINHHSPHCLPLGLISSQHIGDDVITRGYPGGYKTENVEIGIYFGNISRLRPDHRFENNAMKGQGQSGGPVYHCATQRVIGLASAVFDPNVMVNAGLAVQFDVLFEQWVGLEEINQKVAQQWDELLKQFDRLPEKTNGSQFIQKVASSSTEVVNPNSLAIVNILDLIKKGAKKSKELEIRHIQIFSELKELWSLDSEAYSTASISLELFQEWWLAYPKGLHAIFEEQQVVGALGIWPVSQKWTNDFRSGKISETELSGKTIKGSGQKPNQNWYVSGIVLKPTWKNSFAITKLLSCSTISWAFNSNLKYPLILWAIAFSEHGERLLAKYGFELNQPGTKMRDGYPLYRKELSNSDISSWILMLQDK